MQLSVLWKSLNKSLLSEGFPHVPMLIVLPLTVIMHCHWRLIPKLWSRRAFVVLCRCTVLRIQTTNLGLVCMYLIQMQIHVQILCMKGHNSLNFVGWWTCWISGIL